MFVHFNKSSQNWLRIRIKSFIKKWCRRISNTMYSRPRRYFQRILLFRWRFFHSVYIILVVHFYRTFTMLPFHSVLLYSRSFLAGFIKCCKYFCIMSFSLFMNVFLHFAYFCGNFQDNHFFLYFGSKRGKSGLFILRTAPWFIIKRRCGFLICTTR